MIKLKHGQGSIICKKRIRKDGTVNKFYEGRYMDENGKCKSVYAKKREDCAKMLKEIYAKKHKVKKQYNVTLKEWILEWYNLYKSKTLRDSSKRTYEQQINLYIIPKLGKYKLKALTTDLLQRFFNSIEYGNTQHKVFILLSASLDKAVVLRHLDFNPCLAVELPKYKRIKKRPFSYEEQTLILNTADDEMKQAFFFLCVTGLRVGEFLALRKSDFNIEEGYFKVDKAIVHGIKGATKSEASNRIVYFIPELFDYFNFKILGTFTYEKIRQRFYRLLKKLNLKGVSLHSTRHTFSTICHSMHITDKTLQVLMGHSTMAMTQDTYTHLIKKGDSEIRNYIQKLCTTISTTI